MDIWETLAPFLPGAWLSALRDASCCDTVQELRLRADQPVTVSLPGTVGYLYPGGVSSMWRTGVFMCDKSTLEQCFLRFCEDSVYAHEAELRQGYIAVPGGIRVGVAGTATINGNCVTAVRDVTSLCIRLPRAHRGCADTLLPIIRQGSYLYSTILVGEPASGKTTLLREVSRRLAAEKFLVSVVDERGEIDGADALCGCDILRGYPKAAGLEIAVRALAPQVVVFDELGDEADVRAVIGCANAGVCVIASLHGDGRNIVTRPAVTELIRHRIFDRFVFLCGREMPGQVRECLSPEVKDGAIHWNVACDARGDGIGPVLLPPFDKTG